MRIAVDARMLTLDIFSSRGVGRYVRGLLSAISEIDGQNEYMLLSASDDSPITEAQISSINAGPLPVFSKAGIWRQHIFLPFDLRKLSLDICHFILADAAPIYNWTGSKSVLTVHDLIAILHRPSNANLRYNTYVSLLRKSLGSASAIITVSEHTRFDVENFLGKSHPPIFVIYHGVNFNMFRPIDRREAFNKVTEKYNIKDPYILYTGGFDSRKRIDKLVDTYSDLLKSGLHHKLVLVGRMEAYQSFIDVMRKIVKLNLFDHVVFTDYIPDEDLVYLYNAADVFVFPSAYEGFGLPLLEALACGTPVIAFNNSSIPEVVGHMGTVVPDGDWKAFGNAICKIVASPESRDDMTERIAWARKFSWSRAAKETIAVYERVANNS